MPVRSQMRRPIIIDHTVDFGDGVQVTFRYDRNKINDAWMNEWTQLERDRDTSAINHGLADLIEAWDITEDDGSPFPPTAENIGIAFNLADKGKLVLELLTASEPTRAEGEGSGTTSSSASTSSTPPLGSLQNGPAPSPLPTPSASLSTK